MTASGEVGFYPIASVVGSPVTQIVLSGAVSNQVAAAGTCKIYYAGSTLHGAGTAANITTLANMLLYTPSHDDSLFSDNITNDWTEFTQSKNGYYSKFTGYTGYRILGFVQVDGAGNYTNPHSYKSGRNKDDNTFTANGQSAWGGTDTKILRLSNLTQMFGDDYIVIDTSANGTYVKFRRDSKASIFFSSYLDGYAMGLSLNSSQLTTAIESITVSDMLAYVNLISASAIGAYEMSTRYKAKNLDIVRIHGGGWVLYAATKAVYRMELEI